MIAAGVATVIGLILAFVLAFRGRGSSGPNKLPSASESQGASTATVFLFCAVVAALELAFIFLVFPAAVYIGVSALFSPDTAFIPFVFFGAVLIAIPIVIYFLFALRSNQPLSS